MSAIDLSELERRETPILSANEAFYLLDRWKVTEACAVERGKTVVKRREAFEIEDTIGCCRLLLNARRIELTGSVPQDQVIHYDAHISFIGLFQACPDKDHVPAVVAAKLEQFEVSWLLGSFANI